MSWLLGRRKEPPGESVSGNLPGDGSKPGNVNAGDSGENTARKQGGNAVGSRSDAYRFDSAALERAAKAARELEHSSRFFGLLLTLF